MEATFGQKERVQIFVEDFTSLLRSGFDFGPHITGLILENETVQEAVKKAGMEAAEAQYRQELEKERRLGIDEGKKLGIDEGKKLGIDEGIDKGKREAARNFYLMGLPEEQIFAATGLRPEDYLGD